MQFTFGITTTEQPQRMGNSTINYVREIIKSIRRNNIPKDKYEIIVIGGKNRYRNDDDVIHIEFDDITKPGWFTRKKNIITKNAKFENIVISHDYLILDDNWYNGFLKFGNEWDICMNVILNSDGSRYRDWCVWDDPDLCITGDDIKIKNNKIVGGSDHRIALAPYDYKKTQYMYISGAYWIAKKKVMLEEPLDEDLVQAAGEDVEWSMRVREKYNYVINTNSIVRLLRSKSISSYYVEGDEKYMNKGWEKQIND